jgi:cytochrome c peroxidase
MSLATTDANHTRRAYPAGRIAAVLLVAATGLLTASFHRPPPIVAIPLTSQVDPRRAHIGERLFHDVRVSRDGGHSCATCHPLDRGGMDGGVVATRRDGLPHRNTPTVFNVSLNGTFNWDGAVQTLEKHTDSVVPALMNITWPELIARLRRDAVYAAAFAAAYPDTLTHNNVLDAIATFERSLLTPRSRFDRYLQGEHEALTRRELEGYELFKSYGCVSCHQGINIGGNMFQRFGVFEAIPSSRLPVTDLGRFLVTRVERDRHVFRVPSLRNVAVTAPYFHDGRAPTLETAVETMARAQLGRTLTARDVSRIVDFLGTLTGEYKGQPLATPRPEGQ